MNRLRRVPPWAWALLFSVALCLPRLGGSGFWDPSELKIADQAREMERAGNLFDPTVGGHFPASKPLGFLLPALGIQLFGARELGARLLGGLAALAALMAVYWAGAGLFRRRAGLLSTLALGSMTMFVLEARQLTTDAPLMACLALAIGGLGRFAWPATGKRRWLDLGIGVAAMVAGFPAGGALISIVLPAASLFGALAVGFSLVASTERPSDGSGDLAAPGVGPQIPAGKRIGSTAIPLLIGVGLVAAVFLIRSMVGIVAGKYSSLLGGVARAGAPAHTFEFLVRQLGFGLFPWSAVAIFALARPLIRLDEDAAGSGGSAAVTPRTNSRLAFGQLFVFFVAGLGFALSAYLVLVLGDGRYVALPAIALAIGVFLDEALEGNRSEPVAGLLIATGTLVVARDFFLTPEELVSVHLVDKVRWPATIAIGNLMLGLAVLIGGGVYAGLAARGRAVGKIPPRDLSGARPWQRRVDQVITRFGRFGLQAALAVAVAFAFFLTQYLVPALSTHFSFKPVLESFARFAKAGEKIGRYRVEGHGSGFYGNGQAMVDIANQGKLVDFLRDPERVFALVSADELAALDTGFKSAKVDYFVVDASSSRFLLLSNRLGAGEPDANPLKKDIWMAPTPPAAGVWQASELPPWKWREPISAVFADSIEMVGVDYPTTVRRPGKIPLELTFRVNARPPSGYKIFVHFDGPAAPRLIGDHDPVNHTFGTAFWLPGEYIRDHFDVDVPLMTTPAGTYTVLMGFWPGGEGKRLKVTRGNNDGSDRVRLGTIEIK